MIKQYFLFFILIHSFYFFSQNQESQFNHISTSDGLSQSSVIAIHQDKLGQMWFGTRDGLNKYDGNSFTIYRNINNNKNSISNNDILSIIEDKDGYIWIGTFNGLNRYNPEKDEFKTYFHSNDSNSLSNNTVWTIKEMSNGEIWAGTSNGLSIYNKKTDTFTNVFHKKSNLKSISGNRVLSILETKNHTIWVGTTFGLSKVLNRNQGNFDFENTTLFNNNTTPLHIQDLLEENNNNILIATKYNGVLFYDNKTKLIDNFISEPQRKKVIKNVRKLTFDNKENLWIGTYNGLSILKKDKTLVTLKNEVNYSNSLSQNSIKSLLKDKKGSIWIGTYYGGVNIWDDENLNFINFSEKNNYKKINYNVISSIEKYKNTLLIGTEGKGINFFDTKTNSVKYLDINNSPTLPDNNIKSLYVDKSNLWIGTMTSGIAIYNLEAKTFKDNNTLKNLLKKTGVYTIKKSNSNTIWLGTFGLGVVKYNIKSNTYKVFKNNANNQNSLSNNLVRSITIDSQKNTWVCTQRGLNKITKESKIERFFYDSNVDAGDDITTLFEDKNKIIWVGTKAKGLFKLEDNIFKTIPLTGKKGIISNIHSILEDDENNLWITTNEGIVKYNIITKNNTIFNQVDGLVGNEFNDNSSLKTENSQFYFGGPRGITSFNTANFTKNSYAPQVLITDFKIKNQSVKVNDKENVLDKTIGYTNNISLSYEEGNFSIQFAIPNFINPKNNSYKYRLKGLENEWVFTSENVAYFTIQNPGNYVFEVLGANNNDIWNETPTTINIHVRPAPWRSWWAFLIYTFIIAIAFYFLKSIQNSKSRLKHELAFKHLENTKKEEDNKAKLEFFTNISHEFRTPLTLILGPLQQILTDYKGSSKMYKKLLVVENSAKHLLQLINRLMDFR